jgi:hypothetical protein
LIVSLVLVACSSDATSNRDPAPSASTARIRCDAEIAIRCPAGYEDGCVHDRTTQHACVPVGSKAHGPCDQPLALDCAAGEVDSCNAKPAFGELHVCVMR